MSEEEILPDTLPIEEIKVECDDYDTDNYISDDFYNETQVKPVNWNHETFTFVENELYKFLNSSLEGKVLLGIYKNTGVLDYTRLKKLIIYKEIAEDPINYKIKTKVFVKLRDLALELFPSENPDRFYVSSFENKFKKFRCAGGCFYNFYKVVRKELREAGMFKSN
ncbi:uncharacterized protein LOC127286810 [Leptopilina boulardi]|uniref:uncharacterized protein LOC127286810 n=1 Tax=Leptopilina boulardi TaxID=63433 RepID=UPI0021F512A6|nr:uncharacterized protein LOC127286810 [Leptopilina boulardi]